MQSRRFVLVGTRVARPDVLALLESALTSGIDVRAAAQRSPDRPSGWAPAGVEVAWHPVVDTQAAPGLGGLVGSWVTRAVRGAAAGLAEQLIADPWLARQVTGGDDEVLLVALDDTAAQALARWRAEASVPSPDGRPWPVLTWDKGAEAIAEEVARRWRDRGRPEGFPTPVAAAPDRPLGARHTLTVVPAPEGGARPGLREALTRTRTVVTVVDTGVVARPHLGADVLVLDGLGPAVLALPAPGTSPVRVAWLRRVTDRRSPWRHLLDGDRVHEEVPADVVDGLAGEGTQHPGQILAAVLDAETVGLVDAVAGEGDAAALELAARLLTDRPEPSAAQVRELAFLTRVTGSLSLEEQVLQRALADPLLAPARARVLEGALARLRDRMLETEPGWLPPLDPAPVHDPVPGRVLHVLKTTLPQRQAGYSVRGHHTLRALVASGVDVVGVAAPAPGEQTEPGEPEETVPQEIVLDGVRYLVPPPVPGEGTAYLTAQARALLAVVQRERPALVHVHSGGRGYDLGLVGAAVARAAGLPWVYEVRGLFESLWTRQPARAERGETFERRMAKEAELVRRADAGVTLAGTMRADLVARGVDADHLVVVPNAVDPAALTPTARDAGLAARWGVTEAFTFGYVTNLDHDREQVEDLVRAAVHLRNEGMSVRALIVGDGTRREEVARTVERLRAEDCVLLTGRVPHEEVAAAYSLLDVLVVPRSDERAARLVTPLKPYEAMAMGLPVVVSRQPALLEVVGDGERGWSYPAGDAAALAALLRRLAADPQERAAVAGRAREWVLAERTWAGNARRYAELYRRVLEGRDRPTG